jgi:hypothetical protein
MRQPISQSFQRVPNLRLAALATALWLGCDAHGLPVSKSDADPDPTATRTTTGSTTNLLPGSGTDGGKAAETSVPANTAKCVTGLPEIKAVSKTTTNNSYQTCAGVIAENKFTNALCTCHDASIQGYLKTDGFDSVKDPTGKDNGGAAVAINNSYINKILTSSGYTEVLGSMSISGTEASTYFGYIKVAGDLRTAGPVTEFGYINVARDIWSADDLVCAGYTKVGRDAHYAAAFPLIATVAGKRVNGPVKVDPLCPCGPQDILDVAAMVADGKAHNDNKAAGIDPAMFNVVVGKMQVPLPCGRIYIENIGGAGELIFDVSGPTALFVDGSIATIGVLRFNLAPQATIDIFVKDTLVLTGRASFGDEKRPAASRIYVGSDKEIVMIGYETFVGNLYAPLARVTAPGYINVLGSVVARDFEVPGYAHFGYDRAITRAGDGCKLPPPPTNTCSKCSGCAGGQACVNGTCGRCTQDSDCCSQLTCNTSTGKCEDLIMVY